jgi:succinate dehydrogenase / fumarate reductase iron-sulfur subunit
VFNCTNACPRDIKITQRIQEVKRALLIGDIDYKGDLSEALESSSH